MVQPACPYFGNCGGCSAQHIDYKLQLENKAKQLSSSIKFTGIKRFGSKEYGYRNRMDFVFHKNGVGLRRKGSWHNIVDIERCEIANEKLNMLLKEVRDFFSVPDYFDVIKKSGTLRYAVIRTPQQDSSISFMLNSDSSRIKEAVEKIREFSNVTTAGNALVSYCPSNTDISISDDYFVVKGSDMLKESYLGKTFWYSSQGFFQNNSEMAEAMQAYCNGLLKKYETSKADLLDLYGGVGTFGIINSSLFKSITIVESIKQCIDAANKNFQENNITNAKALLLDAKQLRKVPLRKPLFVVTDPPRSGMHPKTIECLKELKPEVIIYVSCNVEQLGKDLPKFREYEIKSAALFDLFPQTVHSEAIVELVRKP